jgi:hypothetical protein
MTKELVVSSHRFLLFRESGLCARHFKAVRTGSGSPPAQATSTSAFSILESHRRVPRVTTMIIVPRNMSEDHVEDATGDDNEVVESPDVHVTPIVKLTKVELDSGEASEEQVYTV